MDPTANAQHTPDCVAVEIDRPPALVVEYRPDSNGTVRISTWERCPLCHATLGYHTAREPWRRFHRTWRPTMAVWIATWEHRHNLGGRVT